MILAKNQLFEAGTAPNELLLAASTTVLTAGLVALFYELRIRESVVADLMELVGLDQQIVSAGLLEVAQRRPDAVEALSQKRDHLHVVIDVDRWLREEWPALLARSREGPITARIVLPSRTSTAAAEFAGIERLEHMNRWIRVGDSIEGDWKREASGGVLDESARILVHWIRNCPRFELRQTEDSVWVFLQSPIGRQLDHPNELCLKLSTDDGQIGSHISTAALGHFDALEVLWSGDAQVDAAEED